jgi:hypothetical protein
MADFDFGGASFGDLANFSLGGGDTGGGASFGGGYSLGPSVSQGFDFSVPDVNAGAPADTGFMDLARGAGQGVKSGAEQVGGAVKGVLDPLAAIAKPLLPVAGLATAGMGIASGIQGAKQAAAQNRLARQAQQMQQHSAAATEAAAAPLTEFGKEQLDAARQGQIPAAIQAKINEWKTGYLAAIRDRLARTGQGDSQTMMQWEQWVEQQAKAMEASYLQQEQELGVKGLGAGVSALGSAGQQAGSVAGGATAQRSAIDDLMRQSNEMLAKLNAGAA